MKNFIIKILSIVIFFFSAIGIIVANVKGVDITNFCVAMGVLAFIYFDTKLDDLKGE